MRSGLSACLAFPPGLDWDPLARRTNFACLTTTFWLAVHPIETDTLSLEPQRNPPSLAPFQSRPSHLNMASRATSSKATATVARRALAAFPLNPGRAAAAITPTRTSSSSSSPARLARLAVSPPRRRPRAAELDRWSAVQSFFLQQAAVTSSSSSSTLPASRRGDGRLALRAYASMPSSPSGDNSSSSASAANTDTSTSSSSSHPTPPPHPPLRPHPTRTALLSTYPTSLRRLASQLDPSSDPHARPTKSELLRLTDSWLDRLRIRWKWLTIRGFRRFNADEWSAVASWALVANLGWLVIGTTTFFSAVLLTAKVLNLQGA